MYYNKAILIGNLTRDPETRSLPSGTQVTSFGLATNRVWKDKNGAKQEDTQFHNIVVFGRQAEIVSQYLRKGGSVLVEGRMQTRSWDAQDGVKKYRTEVVAERVQLGPRRAENPSSPGDAGAKESKPPLEEVNINYPEGEANPDDIPF